MNNQWDKIRWTFYQPFYDQITKMFEPCREESIAKLDPKENERVLIVGAGTGQDLPFLGHCRDVTAIDLTPNMLYALSERSQILGMDVNILEMDAQELAFADNQFDCVILHLILAVIPDPYACIKEVERVLVPGGRIVIFDKFVPEGGQASFLRRLMNPFTRLMFSDINRDVDDILSHSNIKKDFDEPVGMGGLFRLIHGKMD